MNAVALQDRLLLFYQLPSRALLSALGKALIVLRNSQHCFSGGLVFHLIRQCAHFFCAEAPVLWIVDETR